MNTIIDVKSKVIPAMIMSRTSGYYANVINMNKAKQEEFSERKYINIEAFKK